MFFSFFLSFFLSLSPLSLPPFSSSFFFTQEVKEDGKQGKETSSAQPISNPPHIFSSPVSFPLHLVCSLLPWTRPPVLRTGASQQRHHPHPCIYSLFPPHIFSFISLITRRRKGREGTTTRTRQVGVNGEKEKGEREKKHKATPFGCTVRPKAPPFLDDRGKQGSPHPKNKTKKKGPLRENVLSFPVMPCHALPCPLNPSMHAYTNDAFPLKSENDSAVSTMLHPVPFPLFHLS